MTTTSRTTAGNTTANIETVNGSATNQADEQDVMPVNGTVTFTIDSFVAEGLPTSLRRGDRVPRQRAELRVVVDAHNDHGLRMQATVNGDDLYCSVSALRARRIGAAAPVLPTPPAKATSTRPPDGNSTLNGGTCCVHPVYPLVRWRS